MRKWMNKIESLGVAAEGNLSLTGIKAGCESAFRSIPPNIKEMKTPLLSLSLSLKGEYTLSRRESNVNFNKRNRDETAINKIEGKRFSRERRAKKKEKKRKRREEKRKET